MTKSELSRYIRDYDDLFDLNWHRDKTTFMRVDGDWVQCVDFRTGPTRDDYIVAHGLIYLKDAGDLALTGTLLIDNLPAPGSRADFVPWQIKAEAHPQIFKLVYERLSERFRPSILRSMDTAEIVGLLQDTSLDWYSNYILFLIALQRKEYARADSFRQKVFPYVDVPSWEKRSSEMLKEYKLPKLSQPDWEKEVECRLYQYYDMAQSDFDSFMTLMEEVRRKNLELLTAAKGGRRIGRLILPK